MTRRWFAVSWCALAAGLALAAQDSQPADEEILAPGRDMLALFYENKTDELWGHFEGSMRDALGSADKLAEFRAQVADQLGAETQIISERTQRLPTARVYIRLARFEKFPGPIEVMFSLSAEDSVNGFYIRPQRKEADTPHLAYETKTALRLPFDGAWHVFWGGRTIDQNYHTVARDQRFAYDILILEDGVSHTGDGKSNEQYHCFGKPLLAPGAGDVFAAQDGIPDCVPGQPNPARPLGNHVILDHGNGEFSFLAHLKQGTVRVRAGQRVAAGDVLGLCGNSGNSTEPHLHYHLQTTGTFQGGEGLPAQFTDYIADGKPVSRGEPVRGQTVQSRADTPGPAASQPSGSRP